MCHQRKESLAFGVWELLCLPEAAHVEECLNGGEVTTGDAILIPSVTHGSGGIIGFVLVWASAACNH